MTLVSIFTAITVLGLSVAGTPTFDITTDLDMSSPYGTTGQTILGGWPIAEVYHLDIVNRDITPDGFTRQAVLAGGTFPGPLIKGFKGDNFRIHVHNYLTNSTMNKTTTVHWHGIDQHRSNWADGVAMVTQCPISSGQSFLYNFNVHEQTGTYWYHSHLGLQYCDGLRGPLVLYDPHDPHGHLYDYDNETTVITLSDWYHLPAAQIQPPFIPDSILINGLGRIDNTSDPLTVLHVQKGRRYRFRLISMACDPNFTFSIDNHTVTIIEADGENTQALPGIDSIQIWAAQRYSFVLEANQPVDNYWIRALVEAGDTTPPGLAILRYEGADEKDPETNQTTPVNPLSEVNLHPLTDPAAPPFNPDDGDKAIELNVTFNDGLFFVNNVSYASPPVPVLLQILNGSRNPFELLPKGSVYGVPPNKDVEISIPGGVLAPITHPIHLHGHSFSVIRSAGENKTNVINPVRRDVVNIGTTGDNVTIRFRTDNVGPWILHCHIDFHLNTGFAIVMAEDINGTAELVHPSESWDWLCPIYDSLPAIDH